MDLYHQYIPFLQWFPLDLFLQSFPWIPLYQWFHLYQWFPFDRFHPSDPWFPCSLFDQEILLHPVFQLDRFYPVDPLSLEDQLDLVFLSAQMFPLHLEYPGFLVLPLDRFLQWFLSDPFLPSDLFLPLDRFPMDRLHRFLLLHRLYRLCLWFLWLPFDP